MDNCLLLAKYILALTSPFFVFHNSIGMCLKSLERVPCLPVTSTFLDLMVILTPFGTLMDSSCMSVFMLAGI
eukprot:CAMPEP_0172704860 /NCGR_PEP_ID=MMETSP1074-20121228/41983_1 /TAXON_ID=2916 /ORGANISM="Ceratium fusus, Strain PA161109" /LENGTH=71 /DNA_ID=CAMNT_0013527101 /DNA_START=84 /DNA_END=299 /DNA_ORIENTATION=-